MLDCYYIIYSIYLNFIALRRRAMKYEKIRLNNDVWEKMIKKYEFDKLLTRKVYERINTARIEIFNGLNILKFC